MTTNADGELRRWKLVLEYDGSSFEGWQIQPNKRTIQGEVEAALAKFLGHPCRTTVSGRTDSGVHAEGQVIAFRSPIERLPDIIRKGLNGCLPDDISCISAERVIPEFDPRRWSWGKTYRYCWLDRPSRSPLRAFRTWWVPKLDHVRMNEAAKLLLGKHDFSSFRASGCAAPHPIREIMDIRVERVEDEVLLWIQGQGFLRHMVRIIAGTLTEIGSGRQDIDWIREILQSCNRQKAGRTAPSQGLCLVSVRYEAGPPPWIGDILNDEG